MSHALVASYYTIQDLATGGKRRVDELVRALMPDVTLLQPTPAHPAYGGATFPVDFGRRKRGINWGIFNLYWPANRRSARRAVLDHDPKVIVSDSIWCHAAFNGMYRTRVLDAQNVDALAIEERFGPRHPFTRLVHAVERQVLEQSARIFCCSEVDAELFTRRYGIDEAKLVVAPNGVRIPSGPAPHDPEADALRQRFPGKTILLFMGKLDYAPNVEALDFITGRVLPELERAAPGRFVCVVTGGPSLPERFQHPLLHYAGRVPEVQPWLETADLCLAPVFSGSGTRLKILEYLGCGKPVVATPKAAEGIAVRDGHDIALAEADGFARRILELAGRPDQARELGRAGHKRVASDYSWDRTAAIWRDGIRSLG